MSKQEITKLVVNWVLAYTALLLFFPPEFKSVNWWVVSIPLFTIVGGFVTLFVIGVIVRARKKLNE
ncbi:MAG: hypothetical protein ACFB0B_20755 [Thermonemataceae bacterium]